VKKKFPHVVFPISTCGFSNFLLWKFFFHSRKFKALLSTSLAALAVTNPLAVAAVSLTGLVFRLVLKKNLSANRNDLIGYWHETFNRGEHYPHGIRNREDVPDSTQNMLVDYTLFAEGAETERKRKQ
jgi:hypothetical protein